ncbi:MAG: M23 family metallopeptidase [Phormidesmis sp.]
MLEKLGRGELAVITSDAIELEPNQVRGTASFPQSPPQSVPQHIHIHTAATSLIDPLDKPDDEPLGPGMSLPKLVITGICAAIIIGSLLYVADRILTVTSSVISDQENVEDIITPRTGDVVAGYEVSDEYGIRPFHPVTGVPNAPHNGVDLAAPVGTPIHAVGEVGDTVTVKCWWDVDGGGWVVNQTAESYPGYTFQSLHTSEKGCREGSAKAGEVIAFSGNSGLGTGEHYDFRVKIDGSYVPPATKYLESAMTGEAPRE